MYFWIVSHLLACQTPWRFSVGCKFSPPDLLKIYFSYKKKNYMKKNAKAAKWSTQKSRCDNVKVVCAGRYARILYCMDKCARGYGYSTGLFKSSAMFMDAAEIPSTLQNADMLQMCQGTAESQPGPLCNGGVMHTSAAMQLNVSNCIVRNTTCNLCGRKGNPLIIAEILVKSHKRQQWTVWSKTF